jgi:CDP-diacylglycerol--glycerol-3-phosphate 3-phosphatidyltransferase
MISVLKLKQLFKNRGGKIKATMQGFGVGFYVLPLSSSLYWFRDGFMYVTIIITIATAVYYVKSAFVPKA